MGGFDGGDYMNDVKIPQEAVGSNRMVSCGHPKHMSQKSLKLMADEIANECHKHYGCLSHNRRMIYSVLRLIQDRTKAANDQAQRPGGYKQKASE